MLFCPVSCVLSHVRYLWSCIYGICMMYIRSVFLKYFGFSAGGVSYLDCLFCDFGCASVTFLASPLDSSLSPFGSRESLKEVVNIIVYWSERPRLTTPTHVMPLLLCSSSAVLLNLRNADHFPGLWYYIQCHTWNPSARDLRLIISSSILANIILKFVILLRYHIKLQ